MTVVVNAQRAGERAYDSQVANRSTPSPACNVSIGNVSESSSVTLPRPVVVARQCMRTLVVGYRSVVQDRVGDERLDLLDDVVRRSTASQVTLIFSAHLRHGFRLFTAVAVLIGSCTGLVADDYVNVATRAQGDVEFGVGYPGVHLVTVLTLPRNELVVASHKADS